MTALKGAASEIIAAGWPGCESREGKAGALPLCAAQRALSASVRQPPGKKELSKPP